ncbi:MAG TPA: G1 family glutamic endopeptidase [Patescibacteria group bacterium]|nr:G1 family glutamic endopeptidase [Patescibacteria group bacterium]
MKRRWLRSRKHYPAWQWGVSIIFIVVVVMVIALVGAHIGTKNNTPSPNSNTYSISTRKNNNWAGYLKYGTSGTAKDMTSVSGDWNEPAITADPNYEGASEWIGIGGYGNFGKDLIQIGTVQDTGPNLGASGVLHYAFYECAPQLQTRIAAFSVQTGDQIKASITQSASGWIMSITNMTNGGTYQTTVSCSPDQSTAEWILEDVIPPGQSNDHPATMPSFSTVTFKNLKVNNLAPGNTNLIKAEIADGSKVLIAPSSLSTEGGSFYIAGTK